MLENIGKNGDNWISEETIDDSVFTDEALKRVEIENIDTGEVEELLNQSLVQNIECQGAYWFIFREKSHEEMLIDTLTKQTEVLVAAVTDLETRVEEIEDKTMVLFKGKNITITEGAASIGKTIDVSTEIVLTDENKVKIILSDMTMEGDPIEDVTDTITLGHIPSWDWRGGEIYSEAFEPAYFTFGAKPLDGPVDQVTLGLTNEQEHFDERTLVIGNIKVEVL